MVKLAKIKDLITDKISGEWGDEVNGEPGVNVLRTTNFTNQGSLNLQSVIRRKISADLIAKKKLSKGDVIIEKSGGSPTQPVGRVVYFDLDGEDYLCNNFTAVLRPSKEIFPKYFFYALYFLHLSKRTLKYQNKTTGILNLKLERYLEEEQIKIPDLSTQKQIAQLLEEANIARQKRKAANALTDQFLQSTFLSTFGDPIANNKRWNKIKVKDIGTVQTGNTPSRSNENYYGSFIEWIKTDNIKPENIFPSVAEEYLSQDGLKVGRSVEKNSILVTCIAGSATTIGNVVLANRKVAFNQQINALTPTNNFDPLFIYTLFKYSKKLIQDNTTKGMKRIITKSGFENLEMIHPPLPLQQKFASIVSDTEQLRQKQKQSERELENLFQALLQKYFG